MNTTIVLNIINLVILLVLLIIIIFILKKVNKVYDQVSVLNACPGNIDFDPTLNYVAEFDIPKFLVSILNLSKLEGEITGAKKDSTNGTFSVTVNSWNKDNKKISTILKGQTYKYDKSTCKLTFRLTDAVQNYLNKFHIVLDPVATVVPNKGIKLTGNWEYVGLKVPLSVIGYPDKQ